MGFMTLMRIYGNKKGLCGKFSAKAYFFVTKSRKNIFIRDIISTTKEKPKG